MELLSNSLAIALDVAPWLLVGLLLAGVIKAWIPERKLAVWLGGPGIGPIARGAIIGAPLPLCSCGAIPAGVALHRGGASRGAIMAFMVGTPGIGVDSVVLTYALMGPFMAVSRALGALAGALAVGLSLAATPTPARGSPPAPAASAGCCRDSGCQPEAAGSPERGPPSALRRTLGGLRYAFQDVLKDIGPWLAIGIVAAGAMVTWIPAESLVGYGSGWVALLVAALAGIPLYLCAQAATPIAAAMIIAGVSPGVALVFLLAAPMTSIATLAVLRREFGLAAVVVFVAVVAASSIAAGLVVDALAASPAINIAAQPGAARELFPPPVQALALTALVLLALLPGTRAR